MRIPWDNVHVIEGDNIPVKLPWIFPGAPLKINGASGNIQGNLTSIRSAHTTIVCKQFKVNCNMMTSSNGNIFSVFSYLFCDRRIPLTKTSWCFLWSAPEQTVEQTMETRVIWDAISLIMTSLWGRVTHICAKKPSLIIGSDNGFSPTRCQAIIWGTAGILLIGPLGTNFSGILMEMQIFSSTKIYLKMPSGKWRPFCLDLNVFRCPA